MIKILFSKKNLKKKLLYNYRNTSVNNLYNILVCLIYFLIFVSLHSVDKALRTKKCFVISFAWLEWGEASEF